MSRPIGKYSSVLSIWLEYFNKRPSIVSKRIVHSIGVGHGAVASAALQSKCLKVKGLDLRSQFPRISQREGTYIPPEVVCSGLKNNFEWHPSVWKTGGQVSLISSNIEGIAEDDLVVIDIDSDYRTIRYLALTINCSNIVLRFLSCENWMRQAIAELSPDEVICTDPQKWEVNNYIIRYSSKKTNLSSTYLMISDLSFNGWMPTIRPTVENILSIINLSIRSSGVQVKNLTPQSLGKTHVKLQELIPTVDSSRSQEIIDQCSLVRVCSKVVRQNPNISRLLIDSCNRDELRIMGSILNFLGNSLDTITII